MPAPQTASSTPLYLFHRTICSSILQLSYRNCYATAGYFSSSQLVNQHLASNPAACYEAWYHYEESSSKPL